MSDPAETETELRVYILVRNDIEMPLGKAFAQVGHAVASTIEKARETAPETLSAYFTAAQPKIALRAKLKDIERAERELAELGIAHAVITDAGRTVFNEPTITCMGIGPVSRSALPKAIRKLQLY